MWLNPRWATWTAMAAATAAGCTTVLGINKDYYPIGAGGAGGGGPSSSSSSSSGSGSGGGAPSSASSGSGGAIQRAIQIGGPLDDTVVAMDVDTMGNIVAAGTFTGTIDIAGS